MRSHFCGFSVFPMNTPSGSCSLRSLRASAFLLLAVPLAFAQSPWLYQNTFDGGLAGEFSSGNPKGFSNGRTAAVSLAEQGRAGVLSVPTSDYFCIETRGNLSCEEGTLRMDVCLRSLPSAPAKGYGKSQALFAARIRTGQFLTLTLRSGKGGTQLALEACAGIDANVSQVALDVGDWKAGQWHTVEVAWKQPNLLYLSVDGQGKEITDATLPNLPAAMLYDLFIGSNTQGTSGHGDTQHVDAYFDNLCIFSSYRYALKDGEHAPRPASTLALDAVNKNPKWIGQDAHRINVYAGKTRADWKQTPVRLAADFGPAWDALDGAGRRAAVDSLRLVQYDPASGEPLVFDETAQGDEKYFRPFRTSPELYWQGKGTVSWTRAGNAPAAYSLYYDTRAPYKKPYPDTVPMTGDGDRLQLGRKGDLNRISFGIMGSFLPFRPAPDAPLGLWAFMGTEDLPRSRDLGYGLYYFEPLQGEGKDAAFAPGQLIYKGSTPFGGVLNGNTLLNMSDLNGDGNPEFVYSGFRTQEMWDFAMKNGRPVVANQQRLPMVGKKQPAEGRTHLFDWNNDGLIDLMSGLRVYFNRGTVQAPRFDTDKPMTLAIDEGHAIKEAEVFSAVKELDFFPVDWDGDGLTDLVCASHFPAIYVRKNIGTKAAPHFGQRERLKTADGRELFIDTMLTRMWVLDFDGDGDLDILFSGEEGYLGFCENEAGPGKPPQLKQTVFLNQLNAPVHAGSLAVAAAVDWDDDGDMDIIVGNSAGRILFYENKGTRETPVWAAAVFLAADGNPIHLIPGLEGSVQGAGEAFWGYANPLVIDWDGDGLKDLIVSGNDMKHYFFKNAGSKGAPKLAAAKLIRLKNPPRDAEGKRTDLPWGIRYTPQGDELITAHRTRPQARDLDGDGVIDYVTIDHENKLAFYKGVRTADGEIVLENPTHPFTVEAPFARGITWNRSGPQDGNWRPGSYGRTVITLADWDNDGDLDLFYDGVNARLYENVGGGSAPRFVDRGDLVSERLTNHNSGPDIVDFDGDGQLDLILGTEPGHVYYFSRPYIERDIPSITELSRQ